MGRIVLHIGTHKTATTTLQKSLFAARQALAKRGVLYPDYGLIGKPPRSSHVAAANALTQPGGSLTKDEARAFFRKVREAARDREVTLLSAESFYRHVADARPGEHAFPDREAYWRRRAAYVDFVRELFGGDPVEVAVVFRRQADYAPSLYQEHVKMTRTTQSFRAFVQSAWYHFAYLEQARLWARAFGTLRVMRFEDLVRDGAVPARFGELVGLDLAAVAAVPPRNVALGVDATILKRQLNGLPEVEDAHVAIRAAQRRFPEAVRGRLERRSFFEGPDDLRAFARRFEADNAALKAEFLPALPPGPLFSERYDTERTFGDRLHPEMLHALVAGGRPEPLWHKAARRLRTAAGRLAGSGAP